MRTKFVFNEILHNVGMSWIICSRKEMLNEIDKINHPIGRIHVHGITQTSVKNYMENFLNILLQMQ